MQMMRNLKKIINCLKSVLCKQPLRNKQDITICRCVLLHFCASSQIMEQLYQLFKQTSIFLGEPQISIHTIILCPKIFSSIFFFVDIHKTRLIHKKFTCGIGRKVHREILICMELTMHGNFDHTKRTLKSNMRVPYWILKVF